jgi:hypothetical protein
MMTSSVAKGTHVCCVPGGGSWKWKRVEESGREWKRVEESGREWNRVEQSGREWKRVEENGREWKRVKEQLMTPMLLPTELTLEVQNGIDKSHKKTKVSVTITTLEASLGFKTQLWKDVLFAALAIA